MNKCTLFLVFGLLFETFTVLAAKGFPHKASLRLGVQDILIPKKYECSSKDYRKDMQQLQETAAGIFKDYPDVTHLMGENVLASISIYIDKVLSWTTSNSTILSSGAISLLEVFSDFNIAGQSASYLVNECVKSIPSAMSAYRKIASSLSNNIGELVHPINDCFADLERLWQDVTKQFQNRHRISGNGEKIDFKEIMKCGQQLANTIGLIAASVLDDCGSVTISNDTFDSIALLIVMLNDCLVGIQFLIVSMASTLHSESGIPDFLHSSLLSLDPFVQDVGDAIMSMTMDINRSVRSLLTKVVGVLSPLNKALNSLLGGISNVVKVTTGQIKNILTSTNLNLRKVIG